VCIVALIILSGVIDYLLEYGSSTTGLKTSIYDSAAGIPKGGSNPNPNLNPYP